MKQNIYVRKFAEVICGPIDLTFDGLYENSSSYWLKVVMPQFQTEGVSCAPTDPLTVSGFFKPADVVKLALDMYDLVHHGHAWCLLYSIIRLNVN
jgi:hypothetical protein